MVSGAYCIVPLHGTCSFWIIVTLLCLGPLPPCASDSDKWANFDVTKALPSELKDYQNYLKSMISKVDSAIADYEKIKTKRFVPISASLPNQYSPYYIDRVEALTALIEKKKKTTTTTTTETPELSTTFISTTESSVESTEESTSNPTSAQTTVTSTKPETTSSTTTTATTTDPLLTGTTEILPTSDSSIPISAAMIQRSPLYSGAFNPTKNSSVDDCRQLSKDELLTELKQKGTYNPDLMAWDASGVFRFFDRAIVDQYERMKKSRKNNFQAVERNVVALERLLGELNLQCNVRSPSVLSKLQNLTLPEPRRSVTSPSIRMTEDEIRVKRQTVTDEWLNSFNKSDIPEELIGRRKQRFIGDVHVVPFGCDKRAGHEDGYLRLCGACQAIRKLPDEFFPPFINEVMCDEDNGCLYFYDYPHGKCRQKYMNFVVLRNVGTSKCQIWEKFNLNVRVSCECFVDEMSFFSKYV